jgi:hypothetical protein
MLAPANKTGKIVEIWGHITGYSRNPYCVPRFSYQIFTQIFKILQISCPGVEGSGVFV